MISRRELIRQLKTKIGINSETKERLTKRDLKELILRIDLLKSNLNFENTTELERSNNGSE